MYTQKVQENMKHQNGGFTLIEVLIAVTIFSTSLAGMLLMVGTGIGNVYVAKNNLTANYLAQEGIELMRYKRDFAIEADPSGGWQTFSSMLNNGLCTPTNPCGVSAVRPLDPPLDCGSGNPTNCRVVQDTTGSLPTGAYDIAGSPGVSSWTPTLFTRKIYFTVPTNNSSDSYIIHSVVTWEEGTGTYTTSMSETIYNWF